MALGALSLMAIGIIHQPNNEAVANTVASVSLEKIPFAKEDKSIIPDDFAYEIGSRFLATISKEDLEKATSVSDIIPKEADWSAYPIQTVQVRLVKYDLELSKVGNDLELTEAQIALLKSAKYSDNIQLLADHAGTLEKEDLNYFITVVPEKEAAYADGKEDLLSYLKKNSEVMVAHVRDKEFKGGKIMFTVNTQGAISNVRLTESSGFPLLNQRMIDLISNAPGKWIPAENAEGEKVEQILIFSFGRLGC